MGITVIGAGGFIGRHVVAELERQARPHRTLGREERTEGRSLGDVVYCAGVTSDFRSRPLDTVAAHVCGLESLLRGADVRSLVYLSTTRVYRSPDAGTEESPLRLSPADPSHLYDLSKALGEALALSSRVPALALRVANVFGVDPGSQAFLASILHDAVAHGRVRLQTALESTRNYVGVDDVVTALLALLDDDARGIYNVAGERNVSHREITERLASLTDCSVEVVPGAPVETAPEISLARIRERVEFAPEPVLDALPRLVRGYRGS